MLLELKLHTVMKQQNALRVSDADNANLFFVPAYPVAYCTARTHQRSAEPFLGGVGFWLAEIRWWNVCGLAVPASMDVRAF